MFVEKGSETEQRLVSPSTTKPLNLIKLNHFKTKASAHLKDGNYIAAYETYSMCIDMVLESSSSSSSQKKKEQRRNARPRVSLLQPIADVRESWEIYARVRRRIKM